MSLGGKEKTTYSYFEDIGKDDGCVSVDSREPPEAMVETGSHLGSAYPQRRKWRLLWDFSHVGLKLEIC